MGRLPPQAGQQALSRGAGVSADPASWYEDLMVERASAQFEGLTNRRPSPQAQARMRETFRIQGITQPPVQQEEASK